MPARLQFHCVQCRLGERTPSTCQLRRRQHRLDIAVQFCDPLHPPAQVRYSGKSWVRGWGQGGGVEDGGRSSRSGHPKSTCVQSRVAISGSSKGVRDCSTQALDGLSAHPLGQRHMPVPWVVGHQVEKVAARHLNKSNSLGALVRRTRPRLQLQLERWPRWSWPGCWGERPSQRPGKMGRPI